ncbi:MAG: alkaline phosphatase [Flavobacteriales bacterium]|nr:alkaline phosphatase [Flavobacteriales bacterium]
MKKTLILCAALLFGAVTFAQEKGTPAAVNKKADENSTETKKSDRISVYTNDFTYTPYSPTFKTDGTTKKIKNVILMIGDGMGMAQAVAGYYANGNDLAILKLKNMGYVRTYSASAFTTDSAASGTTYACGVKTTNGFIGTTPDSIPAPNLPEKISDKGFATGIVTTDNISGATPYVFYAHSASRKATKEILEQMAGSKLDFFAGGCVTLWNKYAPEEINKLAKADWTIINNYKEIDKNISAKRLGIIAYDKDINPIMSGRGDFLPSTTKDAIKYLSQKSKKGFFMMVEGAQIDWGSHNNDTKYVVTEVIDFDKAVSEALRFADENGETLVIITADHETGGMTMPDGSYAKKMIKGAFTTSGHSGIMVPVYAYGPYSQMFRGVQENIDVHAKIIEILSKVK